MNSTKPSAPAAALAGCRRLHFIGVQVVDRAAFAAVSSDAPSEVLKSIYPWLIAASRGSVRVWASEVAFHDIGTPLDYLASAPLAAGTAGVGIGAVSVSFDKIEDTVNNVNDILVTISIAVVTIAIIWAGFKMIFQGARLADVANVLIGGTLVGGAAAFASTAG